MKLSIYLKSYLNSSLVRTSFVTGILLWALIQLPLLWLFFTIYSSGEFKARASRNAAIENLLVDTFIKASRFGELVNAKGQVLSLGKPLGVLDMEICKDSEEILPRFGESHCLPMTQANAQHWVSLGDSQISIRFYWKGWKSETGPIIVAAFATSASISLLLVFAATVFTYWALSRKVKELCSAIASMTAETNQLAPPEDAPEFSVVTETVAKLMEEIRLSHKTNAELATRAALVDLASQVSHDIRSPLSALRMIAGGMLSNEHSQIVKMAVARIGSIADSMLDRTRRPNVQTVKLETATAEPISLSPVPVHIPSLLDALIAETRLALIPKPGISLKTSIATQLDAFSNAGSSELMRVLSNLINNSIEAYPTSVGVVSIAMHLYKDRIGITIADNGVGIPPDVMPRLFERGASFGKDNGNGLGLYHAKTYVESLNGRITIQSRPGLGTIVSVQLPRADKPEWIISELNIRIGSRVIIFDSDSNTAQAWRDRLARIENSSSITVSWFANIEAIESEVTTQGKGYKNELYLVGCDFRNQNGIDLIEALGIYDRTIVVTSDPDSARKLNSRVRLLPSCARNEVPITILPA